MHDRFLCVLAVYDDDAESRLAAMQQKLYDSGFAGTQTKDIPMHITMGTFPAGKEQEAAALVRSAAENTQPFTVSLSHVGIFAGSEVLFAAPDCSRELLELRERFVPSPGWVPHTTMLIDCPQTIQRALPELMEVFAPFCGKLTSLQLYEFFPARHILTVALGQAQSDDQEEKR